MAHWIFQNINKNISPTMRNHLPFSLRRYHLCLWGFFILVLRQDNLCQQIPTKDWLAEGKKQIAEGHFAEAVAAFNQFKQTAPQDPRPYFFSGIALAEAGHLSAAEAELSEAVRLDPNQPEYLLAHANVLTRLGQKSLAVRALALFENDANTDRLSTAGLWQLADVYYRLEMAEQTLKILGLIQRREPRDSNVDLLRGRALKLTGNLDQAEEAFRNCLDKSPKNGPAHFELGKILEQRNQTQEAKAALLEALKLGENNPEYLHELGAVCLALNQVDEAIGYLERAEHIGSNLPQISYALAQAYQRKGDRAKAAGYLNLKKVQEGNMAQREKEIREEEETSLVTLGEEKLRQGNRSQAQALFEQVLQVNPDNWQANEYLAKIHLNSGQWQEAKPYLIKMEALDPNASEGNFLMAYLYYHLHEFALARQYGERAKAVQPADAELRNLLGNIYLKLGQPEKAFEEYSAAVQLAPDRTDFRTNLESTSKTR